MIIIDVVPTDVLATRTVWTDGVLGVGVVFDEAQAPSVVTRSAAR
jgi:hypothetical protein